MPPRILQHTLHLFEFRPTATNRFWSPLPTRTSYYSNLPSPTQTAILFASTSSSQPSPQLAAQYSSYTPLPGKSPCATPSTMATATNIDLSLVTDSGVFSSGVREDTAQTASEILQEDMATHHVFFNDQHFHSMPLLIYLPATA